VDVALSGYLFRVHGKKRTVNNELRAYGFITVLRFFIDLSENSANLSKASNEDMFHKSMHFRGIQFSRLRYVVYTIKID